MGALGTLLAAWSGTDILLLLIPRLSGWKQWLARVLIPALIATLLVWGFATVTLAHVVLILGTGNILVRMLLRASSNTFMQGGYSALKGGRVIGPLERIMIFGFMLAGEPAAAALVACAKSILRFPEVTYRMGGPGSTGRADSFQMSEYFLLGFPGSWLLALVFVGLVRLS